MQNRPRDRAQRRVTRPETLKGTLADLGRSGALYVSYCVVRERAPRWERRRDSANGHPLTTPRRENAFAQHCTTLPARTAPEPEPEPEPPATVRSQIFGRDRVAPCFMSVHV